MAKEIERKFLVRDDSWRPHVASVIAITQFYLQSGIPNRSFRVRIVGDEAFLTLKFGGAALARDEFEYAIPVADAQQLRQFATGAAVAKTRHVVPWQGRSYEIDVFEGALKGLIVAELESTDGFPARLPAWIGRDVTGDERYYNASLAAYGLPRNERAGASLRPGEGLSSEIHRLIEAEIAAIRTLPSATPQERARLLHETRKAIKRVRAILRLARTGAPEEFKAEDLRWRDLGRAFADGRTASALVEALDRLTRDFPQETAAGEIDPVRAVLTRRRDEALADSETVDDVIARLPAFLDEASAAVARLSVAEDRREAAVVVADGTGAVLRAARKSMRKARNGGHAEDFHDLRKAVKRHWTQLALLGDLWPGAVGPRRRALKQLGEALGELNDIQALRPVVEELKGEVETKASARHVLRLLDRREKILRRDTLDRAADLFDKKSSGFARAVERAFFEAVA